MTESADRCSLSKGKTLRTATRRKAGHVPSTADVGGILSAASARKTAIASLEDAKAEDIVSIDIKGKSALADFMLVASGRSHRHVAAIADQLVQALKKAGCGSVRVDGLPSADWVLVDTGDLIIHVFRPEVRDFYAIEKLWSAPDLGEDTVH